MKKLNVLSIAAIVCYSMLAAFGCSNPYINPDISKAKSEEKQVELLQSQDTLLREQNKELKRIADALERLSNSR